MPRSAVLAVVGVRNPYNNNNNTIPPIVKERHQTSPHRRAMPLLHLEKNPLVARGPQVDMHIPMAAGAVAVYGVGAEV